MSSDTARTGPRFLAIVVGIAATGLAINFIQNLGSMITSIFLAVNLLIIVYPLQAWLNKRRVPRGVGAVVSLLLVFTVLALFLWSLGWAIAALVQELPNYSRQMNSLYADAIDRLSQFGLTERQITAQLKGITPDKIIGVVQTVYSGATGVLSLLSIVVVISFFLAMDSVGVPHRLDIAERYHPRLVMALEAFAVGVRKYWVVSSVFGAIMAVLDVIALMLLGVPLALVWGVLAFITNFIPNIGFVIGLIPPALMGTLAGGPRTGLFVVIAYCVLNFVIQSIIQPKFAGDAVGVTPTLSFVSLLFWAWCLGPVGALLALPLTLLTKALLVDSDPDARWANSLIAADPTTATAPSTVQAVDPELAGETIDQPSRDVSAPQEMPGDAQRTQDAAPAIGRRSGEPMTAAAGPGAPGAARDSGTTTSAGGATAPRDPRSIDN